jgi:hypothetical protein
LARELLWIIPWRLLVLAMPRILQGRWRCSVLLFLHPNVGWRQRVGLLLLDPDVGRDG